MIHRNRTLHLLTNTVLMGNMTRICGRGNRFSGRFAPLRFSTRITIKGDRNSISLSDGVLGHSKIYIQGSGNSFHVDGDCSIHHTVIWIVGDNNTITLGKRVRINNAELGAEHTGSVVCLKDGARVGGFVALGLGQNRTILSRIYASEGCTVEIGEECAVSDAVTIRTSDSHAIYDGDGQRINHARDVVIGNGVWICSGATLFKGAKLGDGSILGGNSMLTKDYGSFKHTMVAGSPARPIRENIRWDFDFD